MSSENKVADKQMRWYDWAFGALLLSTFVGNFLWGGLAAVVVLALLLFASYRLGKALGR